MPFIIFKIISVVCVTIIAKVAIDNVSKCSPAKDMDQISPSDIDMHQIGSRQDDVINQVVQHNHQNIQQ